MNNGIHGEIKINYPICRLLGWMSLFSLLCSRGYTQSLPYAGDIEISGIPEITTKGIFRDSVSVVFCSRRNPVDYMIVHQQNFDITCDPNPATQAGIRYLILTKKPPKTHVRDLVSLQNLSVHRKGGQIVVLGPGVADNLSINEGQLTTLGLERPFEVWIIPFISHNIRSTSFEGHFESDDQCLGFNLGSAISFLALKKIQPWAVLYPAGLMDYVLFSQQ